MYDANHHFPLAHCSQFILEDFFFSLSSTSLFPLDPWLCAPQARTLEMWRGVVKGVWGPLAGDAPRIDTKRQIESRNLWENAKRQVWNTILKREAAGMGRIHVCDACAAPCDDPESQMDVSLAPLRQAHAAMCAVRVIR